MLMHSTLNVQRARLAVSKRLYWIPLLVLLIWTVAPLLWGFLASFKSYGEIYQVPPTILPEQFLLRAYRIVFEFRGFFRMVFNSAYLAFSTAAVAVVVSVLAAYGFARYRFKFATLFLMFIFIPRIIPRSSLIIPLFRMMGTLGLLDSHLALFVSYIATAIPMSTIILLSFFRSIPITLEESAEMDGAGLFKKIWYIVVPMSAPAVITVAVIAVREGWNEFPFAMSLITSTGKRTLPYQLFMLRDTLGIEDWTIVLAFAMLTIIPIVLLYLVLQKYVTSGLLKGALK